ncbi:hypothetical protein VTN49DRAFT_7166 [Thermomyces lanuginosus]|uniref:uncharacterized protein n=1 Tax=Thermomyces lanuginosus TaxID=5541 RepID=UPI0037443199
MSGAGPRIFGGVPDVLFQILSIVDASMIPTLCCLNKATYATIKEHEMLICTAFLRNHSSFPLDWILTMDPSTGKPAPVNFINLQKFMYRQDTARRLASRVARSGWGAWWAIKGSGEMDADAELFRQRVERGLYVMFQMSDIAREVERTNPRTPSCYAWLHRDILWSWLPCGVGRPRRKQAWWFPHHLGHISAVLVRKAQQREVGKRRWLFRQHLDLERRVDFHIALRMLQQFLQTIIYAHCPDDEQRTVAGSATSSSGDSDADLVMSWFLLRQSSHSLSRIFLELPDARCCSIEDRARRKGSQECVYSEALKEYWTAWRGDPTLDCRRCEWYLRSWSTDGILNDFFGQHACQLARDWVRQMRGEGELLFDI